MINRIEFGGEVRDPILGDIKIFDYEFDIINTTPFQRLRWLSQLPAADLVFPGATHSRFCHSLGVLELASRIYQNSDIVI